MGTTGQPEVAVKIVATTAGLTAGFDEAVRQTERGVNRITSAMGGLEQTVAVQTRVAGSMRAVSAASEVSGARFAQAASKGLILVDVLSRAGTVSGGTVAKLLTFGSTAASVFGPGGIAFAAVLAFGALFVSQMSKARDAMEETRRKFLDSIKEMVNAGDVEQMKKLAQDIWVGTPAEKFADGVLGARRRLAELKAELATLNPVSGTAGDVRAQIAATEADLARLEEQFKTLRQAATDLANVPQIFGAKPVEITATRGGAAGAGKDTGDPLAQGQAAIEEKAIDLSMKLKAIREQEREDLARNAEAEREAIADYQQGWETALSRVSFLFERAFAGIFDGTKSLGDAFRDFGRGFLSMMADSISRSLQMWIAAEITKRVYGAATAKQTVANAAVEAGAKAWSAVVGIPIVGPFLAPAAAALAFAGVLAFGSSIKSAAGGWGQVPEDQMAMVHKNEMVLPASIADSVRRMTEGGGAAGGAVNFTVQALDAQSFDAYLRRNGSSLSDALMQLVRSGQLPLRTA